MKILQLSTFFLLLLACNAPSKNEPFKGKEFEGLITYRVTYDNYPREGAFGDTLWVWYSKGDLLKVCNSKRADASRKELFLLKGNRYFFQLGDSDSLYYADIGSDRLTTLEDSRHFATETRILGQDCDEIEHRLKLNKWQSSFVSTYLYSQNVLRMDKRLFRLRKFASFDVYMEEAGAFYLKYTESEQFPGKKGLSSHSFTAVKIQEGPVDPKIFLLDTSKARLFRME
jgi:hypothetical protein